ncbi:SRPBCC family protein [Nocardiopsis changdeensis]|uniref:SRPBCC family protein n=1 Tax=Nocardiopsis changdeensis TaxID=2831969 RepID=A0ABX8BSA8_9ACTN|nr:MULTISPECIES: SRPBCC family protein [Nocardiopsis]QUX25125.1 SRPBCC family protein [Nocardiopsis changdeensis]QYX35512.1 SRPBCC family protein [Nocardiopsis sp. MT53]
MTEKRVDRGERRIAAPPGDVYRALLDPAALERWLPPEGMTGRMEHFDPRPGGGFRLTLTYREPGRGKTDADTDVVEVGFADLVPGERVVQKAVFDSDDPAFAGTMTMTWALAPDGGGTVVTVAAEDVPPGISAEDHAAGLASSLAQLAAFVEPR